KEGAPVTTSGEDAAVGDEEVERGGLGGAGIREAADDVHGVGHRRNDVGDAGALERSARLEPRHEDVKAALGVGGSGDEGAEVAVDFAARLGAQAEEAAHSSKEYAAERTPSRPRLRRLMPALRFERIPGALPRVEAAEERVRVIAVLAKLERHPGARFLVASG